MKDRHPDVGLKRLCGLFGVTRHAYYDMLWRDRRQSVERAIILELVMELRETLKKVGTRKLYEDLQLRLAGKNISIGRDALFDLLREEGLLIRKRKRRKPSTTNSDHPFPRYSNLAREIVPCAPEELWVSDITYIELSDEYCYLSLITDAYSRKIVGYCLSDNLAVDGCITALNMALAARTRFTAGLIHHSDQGVQYGSREYVEMLNARRIYVSMSAKGNPYQNAIAERVNGILKQEFELSQVFVGYTDAKSAVEHAITLYNDVRRHASCDYLTPSEAHQRQGELRKRWKNYNAEKVLT